MFEFTWTSPTYWSTTYCVIAFICYVLLYRKRGISNVRTFRNKADKGLLFFSLLLIITISVDGDWYHYQALVWSYDFSPNAYNHGEPIYRYIILFINKNYILFRLAVWGTAFWISYKTFRRFNLNANTAVFFIIAVFLLKFNYARSTLAMACYFYGLSFILLRTHRLRAYDFILAALFMVLSYSFHHSCLLLIACTFVLFIPINKYMVAGAIVLLPVLTSITAHYLSLFIGDAEILNNDYLQSRLAGYSEREFEDSNTFGKIANVIQYGAFYIPIVTTTFYIFKNKNCVATPILNLYKITLAIALISITFLLISTNLLTFYYRILFMVFIPLSIITVYLYQNKFLPYKWFSFIVWWGIISNMYRILYCLYTTLR